MAAHDMLGTTLKGDIDSWEHAATGPDDMGAGRLAAGDAVRQQRANAQ